VPPRSLDQWLDYQQSVHPRTIALGLDRVRAVAARLGLTRPAPRVITVGGTNGKGSTVAFCDAIARAAGLRVGCYTSPHLLRYNERVRIHGIEVEDAALIDAFERIEAARGEIALTYFEFGTLAALLIFEAQALDLAVLEVGLGGRLDAVNLVDADVAVVTTVDLDHQDYLGPDREAIGREKAGIFRAGRVAVIGEADPPRGLVQHAEAIGAVLRRLDGYFRFAGAGDGAWHYQDAGGELVLPTPQHLVAPCQLANAAAAICALRAANLPIAATAFANGVAAARVPGRLQRIGERPVIIVDVAHNPQAARVLANWLRMQPRAGRNLAVFAALADKAIEDIVAPLAPWIDVWALAELRDAGPRALPVTELAQRVARGAPQAAMTSYADVPTALAATRVMAAPDDRILVFGSFYTVAAALAASPNA